MGYHFLHQGIFPTQGLNSRLLHWQTDSLRLSHLRSLEGAEGRCFCPGPSGLTGFEAAKSSHLALKAPSCLQDACYSSKHERCPEQFLHSQNTLGQSVQRQEARSHFLAQVFTNKVSTLRRLRRVSALWPELSQGPFLSTTGSGLEQSSLLCGPERDPYHPSGQRLPLGSASKD